MDVIFFHDSIEYFQLIFGRYPNQKEINALYALWSLDPRPQGTVTFQRDGWMVIADQLEVC